MRLFFISSIHLYAFDIFFYILCNPVINHTQYFAEKENRVNWSTIFDLHVVDFVPK